ncbi:hypothetical protein I7X12_17670 [Halosimplex litoreum]|uniref:Zinc-ribbon domain-containing protein n=1 Tax=Halosimplex litoreum TaxID=1198301 RepID=A0A7U3WTC3_9EURY|nr:hypothetical protein [Halosimplex litoreum]QPV65187.1 hypothetical protein I7X12_17670 [Halosimplex litoreum]
MSLFASLVTRAAPETVVAECRRCGTTVEPGTAVCATCGSEDIVRYTID